MNTEKKVFFVDFSGYCEIEAKTEEEAEEKFWEHFSENKMLPNAVYEIEGLEEKE